MSLILNENPRIIACGIWDSRKSYPDNYQYGKRTLKTYEIDMAVQESGITFINDIRIPNTTSSVLFSKPGDVRYGITPTVSYFIHFTAEAKELIDLLETIPHVVNVESRVSLEKLFFPIVIKFNSSNINDSIAVKGKMYTLLYKLLSLSMNQESTTPVSSQQKLALQAALEFLEYHYMDKLTLEDISKKVNLSRIYFRNLFTKAYGVSPQRHILNKRIAAAKELLLIPSLSMADIAEKVGFDSQTYFNTVFKKEVGMTPNQFRNSLYLNTDE